MTFSGRKTEDEAKQDDKEDMFPIDYDQPKIPAGFWFWLGSACLGFEYILVICVYYSK